MANGINITAIIIALNEEAFINTCLKAIYRFTQRIIVITNYDTDYSGNKLTPDTTIESLLKVADPEGKIVLIAYRNIKDEVIQRCWAMGADSALFDAANRRFLPHAHSLKEIKYAYPKTDYFWIIDADEIYDPETIPAIIDFVSNSNASAIAVRGYNHFKKWNYRISLETDLFWQIGFLRPGRLFWARRCLYYPRFMGWLWHINAGISEKMIQLFQDQIKLPEEIGCFYHGSYIGDTERIRKKLYTSSHSREIGKEGIERWITDVWEQWTPKMKNFFLAVKPEAFSEVSCISNEELPKIISESKWPQGWLENH